MAPQQLVGKAAANRDRARTQYVGDRGSQIGKGFLCSQISAGAHAGADGKQRDVLARVIRAGRRRIVAVIGSEKEQVTRSQFSQQLWYSGICCLQCIGIASRIVAMTVQHVKVYQVDKDQPPVARTHKLQRCVHTSHVVGTVDCVGDPAMCENVLDLADSHHALSGRNQPIEDGWMRWLGREIPAVLGANILAIHRPDKGPRNHPSHIVLILQDSARDLTDVVKLVERDHLLVSSDLKNAVGGSVDDGIAGAHMLVPECLDDHRPGRGIVPQRLAPDPFLKGGNDLWRKALWIGR